MSGVDVSGLYGRTAEEKTKLEVNGPACFLARGRSRHRFNSGTGTRIYEQLSQVPWTLGKTVSRSKS